VRSIGEVSSRLARRAVAVAETRRGVAIVFVVALALWWLEALVLPLGGGRDSPRLQGACRPRPGCSAQPADRVPGRRDGRGTADWRQKPTDLR